MSWTITGTQKVYTWNARDDLRQSLSGTRTNPNGVWSYGRLASLSGTSITRALVSTSTGWQDNTLSFNTPFFTTSPASLSIGSHTPVPAGLAATVIRWTAPISCSISIDSSIAKVATAGDGVIFAVYKNSGALFTSTAINGPTGTSTYLGSTSVSAGDFLDFKVGVNGNADFDSFDYTKILLVGTR